MQRPWKMWGFVAVMVCAMAASASASPRKPTAPVDVKVETRSVGGATYEVTLVATPKKHVKGLVLELEGRRLVVGTLAAGKTRTLSARISLGALRGRDVVGGAVVDVGGHRRRAAASARIGAAAVAPPAPHMVRLPDGTEAAEVRP
ncbi:MAG TPA: hypothetical protein VM261_30820 [Kofleriaceae bacterium]|nr:hypothetical protein [Kofleriaceae bacterium]